MDQRTSNIDLQQFNSYLLNQRHYSDKTASAYLLDLCQLVNFAEGDLRNLTRDDIRLFIDYLYEQKLSKRTIARKLTTLRTFYNYLLRHKIIEVSPLENITNPKIEKKLPPYLFIKKIEELIQLSVGNDEVLKNRNQAIIALLFDSGIRVSELAQLKIKDIDFNEQALKIVGKGNKQRFTFFSSLTANPLLAYLKTRENDSEYVFLNYQGQPLSVRGVQKIIKQYGEILGIELHPHLLRHTFATYLLDQGADLRMVQELLGHQSLSSTQVYTHISDEHLAKSYQNCHPHGRKKG